MIREDFNEQFGVPIRTYFGLTETAGICAAETSANHKRNADGGIGNPVDALFRVVDDEGYDLPAGEKGALWIQSANLMQGYYLNAKATGQSFNGRWFKTGDLAVRHTDGSYSIIGRINDQAKNNYGEILDASGIIDYLLSCEEIEDAETCSIPDRQGDNRLACFIVYSKTKKDQNQSNQVSQLRSQLADKFGSKNLPHALVQLDLIPRNSNGKPIISELINKVRN